MFYNFTNTNFKRKQEYVKSQQDLYEEYRADCIVRNVQPTLSGLAKVLGFPDLKTFRRNCDDNLKLQDFVLDIQQQYEENLTKQGGNSSGAQFALCSMFGWKDEKNINITNVSDKDELKDLSTEQLREMLKNG